MTREAADVADLKMREIRGLTALERDHYNANDPRHLVRSRDWAACPYSWREAGNLAPFPMAAATAAETSFSAAQR